MKRTGKILSLVALMLVAVTLLSSCGVNYRTANVADYVSIGETGYKGLAISVNKTIISDRDVAKELFALQYANRTVKTETNDDGVIKQYDTLALRLAIYDDKMNLVFTQFGLNSSAYNEKDSETQAIKGTLAAVSGLSFDVGYGEFGRKEVTLDSTNKITLPVDFLNGIEKAVYGENATHTNVDDFKILDRWNTTTATEGDVLTDMETPFKGFFSVSYMPSYKKDGTTTPINGSVVAPVTVDTYLYENRETGKNDYLEAIYLGLKAIGKDLKCNKDKSIAINVIPVGATWTEEEKAAAAKNEPDNVYIEYNLDFENPTSGTNYKRGTIYTSILFAYVYYNLAPEGEPNYVEPITLEFAPGDSYEGQYKVGSTTEKMAGKKFTVRVFVEKRTAYDFPELTAELIKEKADHADHMEDLTGTDEEIIAKYKAHLKEEMQETADKEAETAAKDLLWKKVVSAAKDGAKKSDAFAKEYAKEEKQYLKYLYYDLGYKSIYDTFEEFAVRYVNMGYDSHYTAMLETYVAADKDGKHLLPVDSTKESIKSSYRQLESIFLKEGYAIAKERALVYLIADKLGVRLSEDELEAKLADAVKKANEEAKESIRDAITVDADEKEEDVKKDLVNALLNSDSSNKTKLNKMSLSELAKHYLLQSYGVSSLDKLPKDLVTRESYLSQVDKESLFGGYQLDVVKAELLKTNSAT
ncbi:MAG: hypothetical protein J6S44_02785, partial [Clostridia bacterium]|nr:hypothetical protein [Clostridia bacterium]